MIFFTGVYGNDIFRKLIWAIYPKGDPQTPEKIPMFRAKNPHPPRWDVLEYPPLKADPLTDSLRLSPPPL